MQITPSSGLAPDEIERLIIEAETSIEKDRDERELIVAAKSTRYSDQAMPAGRWSRSANRSRLEEQQAINGVLNDAEEALVSTT